MEQALSQIASSVAVAKMLTFRWNQLVVSCKLIWQIMKKKHTHTNVRQTTQKLPTDLHNHERSCSISCPFLLTLISMHMTDLPCQYIDLLVLLGLGSNIIIIH